MHFGRIKAFFHGRGYGYIEDHEGREVYFHMSVVDESIVDKLAKDTPVYFDWISTGIGFEALSVKVA